MCTKLCSILTHVADLKLEILNKHALQHSLFPLVRIVRNYYGAHTAGIGCLALSGGKRNALDI